MQVVLDGQSFVMFRDAQGVAGALRDRCPHRFAPLSRGRVRADGRLECPYHGWHFDREGSGRSPSQPSLRQCDVTALQVVERHGYLWLADIGVDPGTVPEFGGDGYAFAGSFRTVFAAPLHVALDNFSEDEHTPWVHTRLGWQAADTDTIEFQAENHPDHTAVIYRARQRPSVLTRLLCLRPGDIFHNEWTTHFDPVRTAYAIYWTCPKTGVQRPIAVRATVFMVPETATQTIFHTFVTLRLDGRPLQRLAPLLHRLAIGLAWSEFRDDANFVRHLKDTPESMAGMRLGKFDKPLIHNRKLLDTHYWGRSRTP